MDLKSSRRYLTMLSPDLSARSDLIFRNSPSNSRRKASKYRTSSAMKRWSLKKKKCRTSSAMKRWWLKKWWLKKRKYRLKKIKPGFKL